MNKKHKFIHGFTLVELLVVISMVGVMTSFLFVFINPFKQIQKAKDAQRQADLSNIRQALDTFYNDNNCFPTTLSFGSAWQVGSTVYMKKIPQDPDCSTGGSCYQYLKDTGGCPQWNVLFSKAALNSNATSCPLQQIPSCVPSNYYQSGYASCVISGTVDCPTLAGMSIPTSGGPQTVPTITIGPTLPPLPPTTTTTTIPTTTTTTTTIPTTTTTTTPTGFRSVRVSSIAALKIALADNTVDEIVVVNGTYLVSPAGSKLANSLWIGSAFAGRTNPVLVRAETIGNVIFNGGGGQLGGIAFEEGAHHQTWQGFVFTNGSPRESGVILFGGYSLLPPAHHITLLDIEVSGLVKSPTGKLQGYPIYFSMAAAPGPHDILIDRFTSSDDGALCGAHLHFYHDYFTGDPAGNYNLQNVIIRNSKLTGTPQAIMIWSRTLTNLLIENTTIINATTFGVRYEYGSAVTLRCVTYTGPGKKFYSSLGPNPPEVTFDDSACVTP